MPAPTAVAPREAARAGTPGRRPYAAAVPQSEGRSLAAHAIVALLIAALGLVVAASLSLTTNAQVSSGGPRARGTAADTPAQPDTAGQPTRTAALRTALVREVAAQRSDRLARSAEAIARSASEASGAARQEQLNQTNRSTQATAARIAQQRLQAAIAARLAAQAAAEDGTAYGTPADPAQPAAAVPASTNGVLPVPSGVVGAHFGQYGSWSRYHTGVDFRAAYGTPIRTVLPGVVLYVGNAGNWAGNHVAVKHADGKTTMYSHMSSMNASVGQAIEAGQVIGYVGQTGRAFGAHLHFELYPVGVRYGDVYKAVDPVPWLRAAGVQTR